MCYAHVIFSLSFFCLSCFSVCFLVNFLLSVFPVNFLFFVCSFLYFLFLLLSLFFPYQEFEAKQGHNEDLGKVIGQKYLNYFLEDKALWDPGDEIFTKFLKKEILVPNFPYFQTTKKFFFDAYLK